jgi:voltage-gated sodium channel
MPAAPTLAPAPSPEPAPTPLRRFVDSGRFNAFIIGVILVNAILIGWSTYDPAPWIKVVENVCVAIFIVEIVLRFIARRSSREFFGDGWNIFDLVIIVAALIPASNGMGPILRILRVFRVLRLVKTIPELRLIVSVLVKSVISMKYIGLLAFIMFYVYAVIGVKLFGGDPAHPLHANFATVHESFFTLFRVLTGDDWTQLRYEAINHPTGWKITTFFVTWILVGTFLLINLIVGAIINNYQEVQQIEHRKNNPIDASDERLLELVKEVQEILVRRGLK